jgi:hypothetical protein
MTDLVGLFKSSPEMLKGVMKAAGIEGQPVEMLPSELSVPREKAKAAKPTVN